MDINQAFKDFDAKQPCPCGCCQCGGWVRANNAFYGGVKAAQDDAVEYIAGLQLEIGALRAAILAQDGGDALLAKVMAEVNGSR